MKEIHCDMRFLLPTASYVEIFYAFCYTKQAVALNNPDARDLRRHDAYVTSL